MVLLNCEEVASFDIVLDKISSSSDIIIGNAGLDAELTEIKIWNQSMPIAYLKENYKSPLPILAENKRKLRMKINKQDENQQKKKFGFGQNAFVFGNKNPTTNTTSSIVQSSNINDVKNSKMMYDFNPGELGGNELENSVAYPSLTSVMDDGTNRSISSIHLDGKKSINPYATVNPGEQNLQFGLNFDEIHCTIFFS